ncbi:MAG: S9 family peptidase [Planctomycetota bacterium]|jgi:dipeptidyl aminopeptidase/acylaminoacyl peptidase
MRLRLVSLPLVLCSSLIAQNDYRLPPKQIVDVLEAKPPVRASLDPTGKTLLLIERESMPSIAVQSRKILHLAGHRIDPSTRGPQRGARTTGFQVMDIASGETRRIEVPANSDLGGAIWTADGQRLAFTNTMDDHIQLWVANLSDAKAKQVPGIKITMSMGGGFRGGPAVRWMPDQQHLIATTTPNDLKMPEDSGVPKGPAIQETDGKIAMVRTYQDLLQNERDADLFEYYATSQLAIINPDSGDTQPVGSPGIISSAVPSPDGKQILVTNINRPFSFLVTSGSFPKTVRVFDGKGSEVAKISEHGIADKVPIGGVITGRRSAAWIPTEDATLMWAEALDGGDPRAKVEKRDKIMTLAAPFAGEPKEWMQTGFRFRAGGRGFSGASFGANGDMALITTVDMEKRWMRMWRTNPRDHSVEPSLVHEQSIQERYANPGQPVMEMNARGQIVMRQAGDAIFTRGPGSSPEGDRPFLDHWNLSTGAKSRLFHSAADKYETVTGLMNADGSKLLISRESKTEYPNYYVVDTKSGESRAVTHFTDPVAELTKGISKQFVTYEREDGVPLSATMYLPPGYKEGQRLPTLVWGYPVEFSSAATAGQVSGSQHRYDRMGGSSHLMLLLAGYAVFNNATMPIIGEGRTSNDTYVQQLVDGAAAAVDKAVDMGVADRDRMAIAGHSYGAFMTANLLAHSDLFRAGVARSGAYNRTLTPFGFQNERRTYWEAPEIYFAMSPFMHAPKIDEPILLIHGEVDNNSGTFPIQSKRLFHAIKGHGGKARLVMLPHESHGYRAKESVMHVQAETVDWLNRYVMNAPSEASAKRDGGNR